MYSILVVDDERTIRLGLRIVTDWKRLGFRIAAEAGDGGRALELMCTGKFDVLLADIRLPVLNGLELIETLRKKDVAFRAVLLSAYADFEYARTALRHGIRKYLLKPVDENELAEAFSEIRSELDAERRERVERDAREALRRIVYSENMEQIIEACRQARRKGLRARPPYCSAAIRLDRPERFAAVLAKVRGRLEAPRAGYACEDGVDVLAVFFVSPRSSLETIRAHAGGVRDSLRRSLGEGFRMVLGKPVDSLHDLSASYNGARNLLLFARDLRPGELVDSGRVHDSPAASLPGRRCGEDLLTAIRAADTMEVAKQIDAIRAHFRDSCINPHATHSVMASLLQRVSDLCDDMDYLSLVEDVVGHRDAEGMLQAFQRICVDACMRFALKSDGVIATLREYIHAHCAERLTIKNISGAFGYNSCYLGRIFGRKHGMTIRDYVSHCRIEKACELLLDGNLRVYAVASMSGYTDLNRFYAAFKRLRGCTPGEYRRKVAAGLERVSPTLHSA